MSGEEDESNSLSVLLCNSFLLFQKKLHSVNESGNEVEFYAAVSMLCSTYARKMFPCFDEPSLKAVFDISIAVCNTSHHALSNMVRIFY